MEPFKIHILGCGSALPTLRHNPSAQVVELRGKQFMIDCGEGTQTQMRRSRIGFNKVVAIFISHIHGDHCFGLIGMLSSFGLLGRTMPLAIYAPKEFKPVLDMMLKTFCYDFDYEIQFHAVDTTKQQVIYEDRSLTVESIPLKHRLPTCGFLFREKPTLPHIRRDMIDFYHIPVSQILMKKVVRYQIRVLQLLPILLAAMLIVATLAICRHCTSALLVLVVFITSLHTSLQISTVPRCTIIVQLHRLHRLLEMLMWVACFLDIIVLNTTMSSSCLRRLKRYFLSRNSLLKV